MKINNKSYMPKEEIYIHNIGITILKSISRFFIHLFYAISIISISVLVVLNSTSVYEYAVYKYELIKYTGLSADVLMDNYRRTIYYIQNPFIKELKFNSVPMSEFGRIHFFEVKRIFVALYVFSIIFIFIMIIKLLTNRNKQVGSNIIKSFNSSVNIMVIIFLSISVVALKDFSKAFYIFHKIFFRNDYWIFDPQIDPIINALPEEFFMVEFTLIVSILIVFTVIIKVFNFKMKNKRSLS